jgi:hypothetical protein
MVVGVLQEGDEGVGVLDILCMLEDNLDVAPEHKGLCRRGTVVDVDVDVVVR